MAFVCVCVFCKVNTVQATCAARFSAQLACGRNSPYETRHVNCGHCDLLRTCYEFNLALFMFYAETESNLIVAYRVASIKHVTGMSAFTPCSRHQSYMFRRLISHHPHGQSVFNV